MTTTPPPGGPLPISLDLEIPYVVRCRCDAPETHRDVPCPQGEVERLDIHVSSRPRRRRRGV